MDAIYIWGEPRGRQHFYMQSTYLQMLFPVEVDDSRHLSISTPILDWVHSLQIVCTTLFCPSDYKNFIRCFFSDQKIVGNSFQPIGGLITGKCIHQGIRRKVTEDVIGQIYYIWFPRILWYEKNVKSRENLKSPEYAAPTSLEKKEDFAPFHYLVWKSFFIVYISHIVSYYNMCIILDAKTYCFFK